MSITLIEVSAKIFVFPEPSVSPEIKILLPQSGNKKLQFSSKAKACQCGDYAFFPELPQYMITNENVFKSINLLSFTNSLAPIHPLEHF